MRLEGKTAVVTGGASGIGRATAETLAAAGAHVVIGDLDQEKGAAVAAAIRESGRKADYFPLDATSLDSIGVFAKTVEEHGLEVDIVVNVAGWGKIQPFMENSPDFWRKVIDLNLLGPVAVTHAFLGGMIARGRGGKVITVASDAGRVGSTGETVYSGAKGGAIAFGKALAREMARYKINVNSICPGPTDTPLLAAVPEKHQEAFVKATPMRRLGKPSEIADAVLFFASSDSDFITGQVLSVSGGMTMVG
ncbi:SDR family NAD(P)-dependent oxidoreductase [Thauera chlorobenzoica]|uniref:Hydroxyacyl-CoA dehydrogenase n=1 Tax=Thauera chlorobenzoica TaxID=96773 RepID=A0A1H5VI14_9RHOO|nr:SDR family NAD(P)-dependent oxidoreductase [Thauera chlorobenzoica]APR05783.1 hydroxyacyl-CoA dehydrogenase [Thauera chlorobenzoica]SEF86874.1 2-hydroxycyclohexanecarboxyl-CoA dehydrogenase [Thauera chlorobenzoica]